MSDHLAKEADRLKSDEIFNMALDAIRAEALEGLALADANDTATIQKLQSRIFSVNEIRTLMDRWIMAADVQEPAGSFA